MWRALREALNSERGGRLKGLLAGLFLGFLYLFIGFWDMLMFAIIVGIAYLIGYIRDRGRLPFDLSPLAEWLTERWRGFK